MVSSIRFRAIQTFIGPPDQRQSIARRLPQESTYTLDEVASLAAFRKQYPHLGHRLLDELPIAFSKQHFLMEPLMRFVILPQVNQNAPIMAATGHDIARLAELKAAMHNYAEAVKPIAEPILADLDRILSEAPHGRAGLLRTMPVIRQKWAELVTQYLQKMVRSPELTAMFADPARNPITKMRQTAEKMVRTNDLHAYSRYTTEQIHNLEAVYKAALKSENPDVVTILRHFGHNSKSQFKLLYTLAHLAIFMADPQDVKRYLKNTHLAHQVYAALPHLAPTSALLERTRQPHPLPQEMHEPLVPHTASVLPATQVLNGVLDYMNFLRGR